MLKGKCNSSLSSKKPLFAVDGDQLVKMQITTDNVVVSANG